MSCDLGILFVIKSVIQYIPGDLSWIIITNGGIRDKSGTSDGTINNGINWYVSILCEYGCSIIQVGYETYPASICEGQNQGDNPKQAS